MGEIERRFLVYIFWIDGIARYVGKGTASRPQKHYIECVTRLTRWHRYLDDAVKRDANIRIERIEGLTEAEALSEEQIIIALYGRKGREQGGCLLNWLSGGDGVTSADAAALFDRPGHLEKVILRNQKTVRSDKWKLNHAAGISRMLADPVHRAKMVAGVQKPETRLKMSTSQKARWQDPAHVEKMRAVHADPTWRGRLSAMATNRHSDATYAAAHAEATKKAMARPEVIAKQMAGVARRFERVGERERVTARLRTVTSTLGARIKRALTFTKVSVRKRMSEAVRAGKARARVERWCAELL